MRGGELIREARSRAGLTQIELAERAQRDRSVIARWEQGIVSPPVESLIACVQACGFDLPLILVPLDTAEDERLRQALHLSPLDRAKQMLEQLVRERESRL